MRGGTSRRPRASSRSPRARPAPAKAPVLVAGYQRGASFVAPHHSTRTKRPAPPRFPSHPVEVRGVHFEDEAHAELAAVGHLAMTGAPIPGQRRRALFEHFHGFAEHDPSGGRPFAQERDVDALAQEYAEEVMDTGTGGSVVSPDVIGDYWRRAAQHGPHE